MEVGPPGEIFAGLTLFYSGQTSTLNQDPRYKTGSTPLEEGEELNKKQVHFFFLLPNPLVSQLF